MRNTGSHEQLMQRFGDPLAMALNYRDRETSLHSDRVVILSRQLGLQLGLDSTEVEDLWIASKFHDVGKVGIPDEVLKKPGKLTATEWQIMKTHASIGAEIVGSLQTERAARLARIVRHHHETISGEGYPDGLRGDGIPFLSRLIAVVDCYDAMTSNREYRIGMPHTLVVTLMEEDSGKKFDKDILAAFLDLIETSPLKTVP